MILADKIITLRKANGWSQEELADQLNVSRQAVSKWESAASIPDLDKIIKMSEIFGVSTDSLLLDDVEDVVYKEGSDSKAIRLGLETTREYLKAAKSSYTAIAYGVMLCILSPVLLITLVLMVENNVINLEENKAIALGLSVLLTIVMIAVSLFILHGMRLSKYVYLEENLIELEYGVEGILRKEYEIIRETFTSRLIFAIVLFFIAIMQLVISVLFYDRVVYQVGILLALASVGVFLLVKHGMQLESYDKLLEQGEFVASKKRSKKRAERYSGVYWTLAVVIYLTLSFTTFRWDRTWIIWPIAGVVYAALEEFLALWDKNN